jgi:hypothetical protein
MCQTKGFIVEDKVYLETYYHYSQDDIQVDETPTKI